MTEIILELPLDLPLGALAIYPGEFEITILESPVATVVGQKRRFRVIGMENKQGYHGARLVHAIEVSG